ncbi:TPA: 2-oxo-4-hydroxy-4-carboxy-5-ureidoimidazoline decarboxylase [Enterobacter asburiae]|jgi:2-oxo-4-hydroxy-4-carboxy-5-ureidoimidazoline decarboxylase|uniref:2-oxo-4-hydroxy-4-carboxy-5-ureidoimidazoline decarboxylase n=1 Tax=Enterobacter TaxID=547 RepID=UPI0015F4E9CE|nr:MULTISPECIES: 2-oxo-4-hydroxy-4-carboxy-5-ureidoimidazoline decarboxylase [Enterobacter]EKS7202671.1 2-oxo-4-hydroxy-4-carboxy-5-ureidoimidazoline decarboxylase [Enterobacter asburiae]ELQ7876055.1 2-oxo-4-hydroxy-4-carboxy-5-ureidoimidazoline decarboxylase [Enterobacter asburiae]ELR9542448.1 2-oxo-4-hydroxy-4-carboxy-5-ureidoimidazoline decarboxylase [Enterobacter asburiae]MDW3570894.1 2-oxo-4-hydroxy-4-carboxy-5-ureidoimidazoline decarboxylase [Enterobacter asburiae]MDZ5638702.1 2-oxo-4-hy
MIALHDFNHLPHEKALALIHPCVALPEWADALALGRPYASREELFDTANALTQNWDEAVLAQALSAHPRIGEKPAGSQAEAALSRQEQGAVNEGDAALARALREGNARYEARFGRVFLIRAKGRSGEEILQALHARLENSDAQEVRAALEQLREITLLRLEGVISE